MKHQKGEELREVSCLRHGERKRSPRRPLLSQISMWEKSVTIAHTSCALRPQRAERMSEEGVDNQGEASVVPELPHWSADVRN